MFFVKQTGTLQVYDRFDIIIYSTSVSRDIFGLFLEIISVEKIQFYEKKCTKYKYQYKRQELHTFHKFTATSSVNELSRLL